MHADNDDSMYIDFGVKDDKEVLRLRTWLEQVTKLFPSDAAQRLMGVVDSVVYEQGYNQGWDDAKHEDKPAIPKFVIDHVWEDGYNLGWAESKSRIADQKEET
jgi:hypothetical protein